jgi:hypothetical protein
MAVNAAVYREVADALEAGSAAPEEPLEDHGEPQPAPVVALA